MDSQIRKRKGKEDDPELYNMHKADKYTVSIHLQDISKSETYPERIITLEHPDWSAVIGRGSSSDIAASPQPGNAWFSSKVMSRHHAELQADPESRILIIKDNGSMHGTLLNGERVPRSGLELLPDDMITFGTQVVAKDNTFAPLKTLVTYQWAEDDTPQADNQQRSFANTFSADYSDADVYSELDDEIEVVGESVRQPSLEILESNLVRLDSSTNTSPRTDSERRTSSSATDPTDHSSILDRAEDSTKIQEVTPAKPMTPLQVSDDSDSEVNDPLEISSSAESVLFDDEHSDDESDQDYNRSDDYSELHDYDGEYGNEQDCSQEDQEEMCAEQNHNDLHSQSPTVAAVEMACSSTIPTNVPLRKPSPSDAAMARPRPASPSQYPPSVSIMRPLPPPPPPAFSCNGPLLPAPPSPSSMLPSSYIPAPATYNPNSFAFPSPYPYGCGVSYPTISNNGPFGYSITSYDALTTNRPAPTPFHGSQPVPVPRVDLVPQSLPSPHTSPSISTWAKLAQNGPNCYRPSISLKRMADEMSDDDDDDWTSDEPTRDSKQLSRPQSPENAPGSPVWHPESPENPKVQVSAVVGTDEPQIAVDSAIQNAKEFIRELEAVNSEASIAADHPLASLDGTTAVVEPVGAIDQAQAVVPTARAETQAVQLPPRKKAKIGESRLRRAGSTAKTAMKYAAVAFAGGAAGAMGTVYALASLPPDYFASAV